MDKIKNSEVLKEVLADSFGGVLYNLENRDKYNTDELLKDWNELTESQQASFDGCVNGAINFLQGN